jgi:hypothetical protein
MPEKLKSWLQDDTVYIAVLLCLVGLVSFGLGRMSVARVANQDNAPAKIQIMASSSILVPQPSPLITLPEAAQAASVVTVPAVHMGPYVGSKSGTKYYLETCSGVKRIKEANKVFFSSVQDARAAGYTPAANCPGL